VLDCSGILKSPLRAREAPISSMDPHVESKVTLHAEASTTNFANVRVFSGVKHCVGDLKAFVIECSGAQGHL